MARPQRNNVDYFPFYCEDGKKMFYLEEKYGNDGFATFVKLLRELAKTDYHYLNLSDKSTKMFLSAKCKVTIEILDNIISDMVDLGKFDGMLWVENSIVWCQDFTDSIQDAYSRRNNKCIDYDGLLLHLISLGVRKPVKCKTKVVKNTQSIVKYSKVKYSKVHRSFDHLSINVIEINKLLDLGYKFEQITSVIDSIENYAPNKKYKSLFATSKNWLKKEYPLVVKEKEETREERLNRLRKEEDKF